MTTNFYPDQMAAEQTYNLPRDFDDSDDNLNSFRQTTFDAKDANRN